MIGIEGILEVFDKEVAVTEGGPCLAIFLIDVDEFDVVFNSCLIIALSSAILGQFVDFININDVVTHEWSVKILLASSLSWR